MAATNSTPLKLSRIADLRAALPKNEPYWEKLGGTSGAFIGFRKTGDVGSSDGTWRVRLWAEDLETGKPKQHYQTLPKAKDFNDAVRQARAWIELREAGIVETAVTVQEACKRYAEKVETVGVDKKGPRPAAAKSMRESFARWVDGTAFGRIELNKLREVDVEDWRERMAKTPIRGGGQRKPSSMNRDFSPLRAALNWAKKRHLIATDAAWTTALEDMAGAVQPRTVYLDADQRRDLMSECEDDLAKFVKAMILLPFRPGAIAQLDVGDFDKRTSMLTVLRDKAGKGRQIKLPPTTAAFFAQQCESDGVRRMPNQPMFVRTSCGVEEPERWHKDSWKHPLKEAVRMCGLDDTTCAYTLRHSAITDLVLAGVPLSQVAQVSGTSIIMIERHYAHLQPSDATAALAAIPA